MRDADSSTSTSSPCSSFPTLDYCYPTQSKYTLNTMPDPVLKKIRTKTPSAPVPIATPQPAKPQLATLRAELERKGLKKQLDSLPSLSAMRIISHTWCTSEHPFALLIGTENNSHIYAVLGSRPSTSDQAPDLLIWKGKSDCRMQNIGRFDKLNLAELVEPFKTLWKNVKEMDEGRTAWDRRRGWFKSFVYWYLLCEAAERGGVIRVPRTIGSQYFGPALRKLGVGMQKRLVVQETVIGGEERERTAEIAATLGELVEHEKEQKKVESRMGEEVEEGNNQETASRNEATRPNIGKREKEEEAQVDEPIAALEDQIRALKTKHARNSAAPCLVLNSPQPLEERSGITSRPHGTAVKSQTTPHRKRKRPLIEEDSDGNKLGTLLLQDSPHISGLSASRADSVTQTTSPAYFPSMEDIVEPDRDVEGQVHSRERLALLRSFQKHNTESRSGPADDNCSTTQRATSGLSQPTLEADSHEARSKKNQLIRGLRLGQGAYNDAKQEHTPPLKNQGVRTDGIRHAINRRTTLALLTLSLTSSTPSLPPPPLMSPSLNTVIAFPNTDPIANLRRAIDEIESLGLKHTAIMQQEEELMERLAKVQDERAAVEKIVEERRVVIGDIARTLGAV
jgi:hypothetical protein